MMRIFYMVDILPRTDGLLNFISGWDDFQPKTFSKKEQAKDWIDKQTWGKYTITKVYSKDEDDVTKPLSYAELQEIFWKAGYKDE